MPKFILAIIIALSFITGAAQAVDKDTEAYIEQQVDQRWQEFLNSSEFQQKIDEGIIRFIQRMEQETQNQARQKGTQELEPINPETDHIRGPMDAEYTLLEYSDFECPFCKRFHNTAAEFISLHDNVNWVYRHFPLNSHNPAAQLQAEASECVAELAGNDAFWAFADTIYEQTRSGGRGFPASRLAPAAQSIGVDADEFKRCLDSNRHRETVLNDLRNGEASGVTGTPGNFLIHNPTGTLVILSGAQPLESLNNTLEALEAQLSQ